MILLGNGFEIGEYGISRDPNGLYGTQEAFGKASFPPNPFKKMFPSTFPYFGKFGEGPLSPLCIPYGPFVGLLGLGPWGPISPWWVPIGPWWGPRFLELGTWDSET